MRIHEQRKLFGKRLRELRLAQDLSQEKLAEMADLHRNYVGILERAQQSPSLDAICKLAHALKVRPAELLSRLP
ncbi:MAG: helix-turn-helix domain-containing protein [Acidobacteriia bacterium]|nr:helix-turn-helix domain-containing protein [Terriglobia bacterium]